MSRGDIVIRPDLADAQVSLPSQSIHRTVILRSMFIGEFCCGLPLLYNYLTSSAKTTAVGAGPDTSVLNRILSRLPLGTGSAPVTPIFQLTRHLKRTMRQ